MKVLDGILGHQDSDKALVFDYVRLRTTRSIKRVSKCRYFRSNVMYCILCAIYLYINAYGYVDNMTPELEWRLQFLYTSTYYLHVINAIMYLYMWTELRTIFSLFILPDWLNLLGSLLYLVSGWLLPLAYDEEHYDEKIRRSAIINMKWFVVVRLLEIVAGSVELIATFGWNIQWYLDYMQDLLLNPIACVGRGFTLDDPDSWANVTLVIAASFYFRYNMVVLFNGSVYEKCTIYEQGDLWYAINSVCYLLCSLRDSELFWFMPTNGKLIDLSYMARMHNLTSGSNAVSIGTNDTELVANAVDKKYTGALVYHRLPSQQLENQ